MFYLSNFYLKKWQDGQTRSRFLSLFLLPFLLPFLSLLFTLITLPFSAHAETQERNLTPIVEFLEDPNHQLTIDDIKNRHNLNFQHWQTSGDINLGFTHSTYWFRFTLTKKHSADENKRLLIPFITLQHIALFSPNQETMLAGSNYAVSDRAWPHRYFVFPIHLTEPTQTYYLQVRTNTAMTVPLTLWNIKEFATETQTTYLGLGIYYGELIALMIYNLLIFIYLREKTFLLYGLFVLSMGFSMAFGNGIGQQYLWSYETFGIWQSQFTVGLYALTMTTAIAFSRSFLQLSHSFHKLDVVLLMILGVSFFIFIASFMTTADWVSQSSALIIMLGTSLLILAGILSHYAGHQSAKFFVLAFGTLCAGAFMSGLRSFDLIPTNMITANSVQLSSAIEMLLLSFALAHRIKVEKEEKEKTQHLLVQTLQKSETLLEQKVAKRTNELKQSLRKEQDTLEKFIRFGSYISHEFRNPLAIIKNQLSTLKKELSLNINENIDKRIETVLTATNRINDLFEGWLHSDRLRQGLTILSITRIDVYDFVSSIAQQCQSLYPDRSIYYESFDQPCYIDVDVDEDMIRLAIINLIDNAVKYSPQNKPIQIALLLKPNKVGIIVEDQGVGIRTEDIPNLFQDYFRLDNDKNIKGVGLGLAFVHKVCELHNSSIEVTSELGKGSRFCIWVNKDNAE